MCLRSGMYEYAFRNNSKHALGNITSPPANLISCVEHILCWFTLKRSVLSTLSRRNENEDERGNDVGSCVPTKKVYNAKFHIGI